jgi:hypothetical protein
MPVPNIIVFDTKWANTIIENLEQLKFNPFYNNKVNSYHWFTENMPIDRHRLYWVYDGNLYDGCVEEWGPEEAQVLPAFCIVFTEEVNAEMWRGIRSWFEIEVFSFNNDEMFKTDEHLQIDEFMTRPGTSRQFYEPEGVDIVYEGLKGKCLTTIPEDNRPNYEFRCKYVPECDSKFYEVSRSNTVLPFTVVVPKFVTDVKDDAWFFTDIYGSNDWDYNRVECKYDFTFLLQLWKVVGLAGEFTIDLVKRRVDSCYIDRIPIGTLPQNEPVVYRRNMDDVISSKLKRKAIETLPSFIKRNKS